MPPRINTDSTVVVCHHAEAGMQGRVLRGTLSVGSNVIVNPPGASLSVRKMTVNEGRVERGGGGVAFSGDFLSIANIEAPYVAPFFLIFKE